MTNFVLKNSVCSPGQCIKFMNALFNLLDLRLQQFFSFITPIFTAKFED